MPKSWSWLVLWRPTAPSRANTKNDVLFTIGDWNAKIGSQETTRVTGKFGLGVQNEAGQRLTWTSPDIWYQNQIDYILCSQRKRSSIQSAKSRPGADCGTDHELLFAKFRLKLKKIRKATKPFRYDLNQIPYNYTVEVTNRFNGLDLTDRVPDELCMEVRAIVQDTVIKTIPRKTNAKKQNGCLRRPYK